MFLELTLVLLGVFAGFSIPAHAGPSPASPTKIGNLKVLNSKRVSPRTLRSGEEVDGQTASQTIPPAEVQSVQPEAPSFGLGISSLSLSAAPTMSGVLQPSLSHQLQADVGIPSTNAFTLDINLGYRFGVHTFDQSGLHVGGFGRMNLVANANATVDLAFSPVAGIHLAITEDLRTLLSFDAGPTLTISGGSLGFRFGALSNFLGLSIHRLF